MNSLFEKFDNIIIFDVETTGFDPIREDIIEIAMIQVTNRNGEPIIEKEFDALIELPPDKKIPSKITELTGITDQQLKEQGISKHKACEGILDILNCDNPLLAAYNAQFDLGFLYYFLKRFDKTEILRKVKMFDILTVYRDRKPFPHKLGDAAIAYSINVESAHRALDDVKVSHELMVKMGYENDDLANYINLFGYNPKYGVSGQKISSITYKQQGFDSKTKLYS